MKRNKTIFNRFLLLFLMITIGITSNLTGQEIRKQINRQIKGISQMNKFVHKQNENPNSWSDQIKNGSQLVDSLVKGLDIKENKKVYLLAAEFHTKVFNFQLNQKDNGLIDTMKWNTSLVKSYDYYVMTYEISSISERKKIDKKIKQLHESVSNLILQLKSEKSYNNIMFYSDFLTLMNITTCEYYCVPNPDHEFYESNQFMSSGIYQMHINGNMVNSYFDIFDNGIYASDTYKLLIDISKHNLDTIAAFSWIDDAKKLGEFNLNLLIEEVMIYNEQEEYQRAIDSIKSYVRKNSPVGGKDLMASVYTQYSNHLLKNKDLLGAIKKMKIARNLSLTPDNSNYDSEIRSAKTNRNLSLLYSLLMEHSDSIKIEKNREVEALRLAAFNDAISHYKYAHRLEKKKLEPIEALMELYNNSPNTDDKKKVNYYRKKRNKIKGI